MEFLTLLVTNLLSKSAFKFEMKEDRIISLPADQMFIKYQGDTSQPLISIDISIHEGCGEIGYITFVHEDEFDE